MNPEQPGPTTDMHQHLLDLLEENAMEAGPLLRTPPFPELFGVKPWATMMRGRRLRIMDMLILDGLTVLNVLPDNVARFLRATEACSLRNRFDFASAMISNDGFWDGLPSWWRSIATYQVHLMALRKKRDLPGPLFDGLSVGLAPGVVLAEFGTYAAEASPIIPSYFLGDKEIIGIQKSLENFVGQTSLDIRWHIVIPATTEADGTLAELDAQTAGVLLSLRNQRVVKLSELKDSLDHETFTALLDARAFAAKGTKA